MAIGCQHSEGTIRRRRGHITHQVCPVKKGRWECCRSIRPEYDITVGDRNSVTVAVDAGQGGQDVVCGMRDEHCMMVRIQSALALEEIQEMRHLFPGRMGHSGYRA